MQEPGETTGDMKAMKKRKKWMKKGEPQTITKAVIHSEWEFNLVEGVLFITAEPPESGQIALSAKVGYDPLEYLYQHHEALYEAAHPQDETTQKLQSPPGPQKPE